MTSFFEKLKLVMINGDASFNYYTTLSRTSDWKRTKAKLCDVTACIIFYAIITDGTTLIFIARRNVGPQAQWRPWPKIFILVPLYPMYVFDSGPRWFNQSAPELSTNQFRSFESDYKSKS